MTTAPAMTTDETHEVTVSREINAPVEKVFALWLDPDQMMTWFGVDGVTNTRCVIESHVGGAWRMEAHGPDHLTFRIEGVFKAIEENRRILQSWQHVSHDGERGNETECEILFAETAKGCRITVNHRNIRFTPERFNEGWTQSLARIERMITG